MYWYLTKFQFDTDQDSKEPNENVTSQCTVMSMMASYFDVRKFMKHENQNIMKVKC